ncbi:MAG: single-stranded DNA-binding protein [Anaerolineales bacterium]
MISRKYCWGVEETDELGAGALDFFQGDGQELALLGLLSGDAPAQVDLVQGHAACLQCSRKRGNSREDTQGFNIEAWGKLAKIINIYLAQGDRVYIEGRLQIDRYEKGGETR